MTCDFCLVPPRFGGITKKKKWRTAYPNIPFALRPVPQGEGLAIPQPPPQHSVDSAGEDEGEPQDIATFVSFTVASFFNPRL